MCFNADTELIILYQSIHLQFVSHSEIEHKPDLVWPSSSHITATAVSKCTSLVAVAVDSGVVTIWDKYLGSMLICFKWKTLVPQLDLLSREVNGHGNEYRDS